MLRKHTAPGNGCMGRVARPLHEAVRDFGERGCQCAALGDNTVTWTQDENIEQALAQRFKSADLDGYDTHVANFGITLSMYEPSVDFD